MKYLSLNKCVHRNLRLEHVYMTNYNDVVITNFGLARVTEALYYQQRRIMASDTFVIYPPEVRDTQDEVTRVGHVTRGWVTWAASGSRG